MATPRAEHEMQLPLSFGVDREGHLKAPSIELRVRYAQGGGFPFTYPPPIENVASRVDFFLSSIQGILVDVM